MAGSQRLCDTAFVIESTERGGGKTEHSQEGKNHEGFCHALWTHDVHYFFPRSSLASNPGAGKGYHIRCNPKKREFIV